MIQGVMTRESVQGAINKGITASQIEQFLIQHAHRDMFIFNKKKYDGAVIHPDVSKRIYLWEKELKRLKPHYPAVLFNNFSTKEMFDKAVSFSNEHEWTIDIHIHKQCFVAHSEGRKDLEEYIKELMFQQQQQQTQLQRMEF
eukprot:CAMPEP_0117425460 /NCGR_PEP_ID=MMETSP0758-20121206/5723_1 /TAXON_ID=63605 /ORGANISM="Percolomonas cosmopolitus, Strain AE-1 (ATCC 50343)" /LENGTH=141 /DNA_ID=CAMNT_0005209949 /DNA_START=534 /DNA_END=959 /DNA_ORIENTATION=-